MRAADRGSQAHREALLPLSSGYVMRALDRIPKEGPGDPWILKMNYALDRRALRRPLRDELLELSGPDRSPDGAESVVA